MKCIKCEGTGRVDVKNNCKACNGANLARAPVTNTCSIHCRKMANTDELFELVCPDFCVGNG